MHLLFIWDCFTLWTFKKSFSNPQKPFIFNKVRIRRDLVLQDVCRVMNNKFKRPQRSTILKFLFKALIYIRDFSTHYLFPYLHIVKTRSRLIPTSLDIWIAIKKIMDSLNLDLAWFWKFRVCATFALCKLFTNNRR